MLWNRDSHSPTSASVKITMSCHFVPKRSYFILNSETNPFSHQHSCSLFPVADYKSNIPANETFIFSKDKKLCFSDCIGNISHCNDILIILSANQSPCSVSGDLLKESDQIFEDQKILKTAPCIYPFFFSGWVDEQILSICKPISKRVNTAGLCFPQFYWPCINTPKKHTVTILKVGSSQWIPERQ